MSSLRLNNAAFMALKYRSERSLFYDAASGDYAQATYTGGADDAFHQDGSDPFSLSCWFKVASGAAQTMFYSRMYRFPTIFRGWQMWAQPTSGQFSLSFFIGGDTIFASSWVRADELVSAEEWHHGVATYDGSKTASGITLYLDGTAATKRTVLDTAWSPFACGGSNTHSHLGLGCRYNENGARDTVHDGWLDEMFFCNYEMTDTQVSGLYNGGQPVHPFHIDAGANSGADGGAWYRMGDRMDGTGFAGVFILWSKHLPSAFGTNAFWNRTQSRWSTDIPT